MQPTGAGPYGRPMNDDARQDDEAVLGVHLEIRLDREPVSGRLRTEQGADEPFVGWLGFVDALKRLQDGGDAAAPAEPAYPTTATPMSPVGRDPAGPQCDAGPSAGLRLGPHGRWTEPAGVCRFIISYPVAKMIVCLDVRGCRQGGRSACPG